MRNIEAKPADDEDAPPELFTVVSNHNLPGIFLGQKYSST